MVLTRSKRKAEGLPCPDDLGLDYYRAERRLIFEGRQACLATMKRLDDIRSKFPDINAHLHELNAGYDLHGTFRWEGCDIKYKPTIEDFPANNPKPEWASDEKYHAIVKNFCEKYEWACTYGSARFLGLGKEEKVINTYDFALQAEWALKVEEQWRREDELAAKTKTLNVM